MVSRPKSPGRLIQSALENGKLPKNGQNIRLFVLIYVHLSVPHGFCGQIALNLGLISPVNHCPSEGPAKNQTPDGVPDQRIRIKAGRKPFQNSELRLWYF